ncbi:MAG: hypothetical protein NC489_08545 [Ruminococcus flavefaciens]|nr:hypothetical protein [Ruminococcus flavefaciens]
MSMNPQSDSICPIAFGLPDSTYVNAKSRSDGLAKFIQTTTITEAIDGIRCTSTDPQLNDLLKDNVFPDYGRNYYPVVIMVASAGGSGKDTFIKMVGDHLSRVYQSRSISTVDPVKDVYDLLQKIMKKSYSRNFAITTGGPIDQLEKHESNKTEEYRQFLHDVKNAWTKVGNGPVLYCLSEYVDCARHNIEMPDYSPEPPVGALFVNNRDLDTYTTMKDWCYQMGVMCIGVKVDGTIQASDYTNDCDSNVDTIPYDIVVNNKSSLESLDRKAAAFAQLFAYGISRYGMWVDNRMTFGQHVKIGCERINRGCEE